MTYKPLCPATDEITSTQASHICNVIRNLVDATDRRHAMLTTLNKEMIVDSELVEVSTANFNYDRFMAEFEATSRYFEVSAVLRVAVKNKAAALRRTEEEECPPDRYEEFTVDMPRPTQSLGMVDDEWGLKHLSDKQRVAYDQAVATAAKLGKTIHNNGLLPRMLGETQQQGVQFEGTGHQQQGLPVVVKCDTEQQADVEKARRQLQAKHAEVSQRLNAMKAQVHELITVENLARCRSNVAVKKSYRVMLAAWEVARAAAEACKAEAIDKWNGEMVEERRKIAKTKVFVPESVKVILREIDVYLAEEKS